MKIFKQGKTRKFRYFYGKCNKCDCEFSVKDNEYLIDYLHGPYYFCPNKYCNNERVFLVSKRKYLK